MPVTRRSNTRQSKEGVVPARKGERRQAPLPLSQAQAPTLALALALALVIKFIIIQIQYRIPTFRLEGVFVKVTVKSIVPWELNNISKLIVFLQLI